MKPSFLKTISLLYQEGGTKAFFRGLPSILSRDIPFYVIFFTSYEMYMSTLLSYYNVSSNIVNPIHYILGGGFAGMIGEFCISFDVIKSRQQSNIKKLSFIEVANDMIYKEGLRRSMKGWAAAVLRGFLNGALFLGVETSKKLMY